MEDSRTEKTPDLIDTTDCLEAIGAIRSMKNFLFVILIACLLVSGAIFWLDQAGRIDKSSSALCPMRAGVVCKGKVCPPQPAVVQAPAAEVKPIEQAAKAVTEAVSAVVAAEPNTPVVAQLPAQPAEVNVPASQVAVPAEEDTTIPAIFRIRPSCQAVSVVVMACNFILVIVATMYCLMLLMSLKISLTGRLGGINHISRAFFISLFGLVILLPWQSLLPGVVAGAIYQPQELLCDWSLRASGSTFWMVMCYIRFFGLWLVVLWLFIWAQVRSGKWARATLRRLGLVR